MVPLSSAGVELPAAFPLNDINFWIGGAKQLFLTARHRIGSVVSTIRNVTFTFPGNPSQTSARHELSFSSHGEMFTIHHKPLYIYMYIYQYIQTQNLVRKLPPKYRTTVGRKKELKSSYTKLLLNRKEIRRD